MSRPSIPPARAEESAPRGWPKSPLHNLHKAPVRWRSPKSVASTRSPSPVTSSQSSGYYAASTTSWATSAEPGAECCFPDEEGPDRWQNSVWNEDSAGAPPPRRPSTPAGLSSRRPNDIRARSPSRPSSLRNAMSARDDGGGPGGVCAEDPESDTDESDCESSCETAGHSDDEEDNDWSGDNGNLEALVVSAVGTDYPLASFLVQLLHRDFSLALKTKVEKWRCATSARGGPDGSAEEPQSSPAEGAQEQRKGMSRKRRRTASNGGNEGGSGGWDEDDDEDEDKGGKMGPPAEPPSDRDLLLACPFHKRDPLRYGAHGQSGSGKKPKYRACAGPGFRTIQRLKEHLKRVHSPVQCERCKQTFHVGSGQDRAQALADLAEHRKKEEPCTLRDASLKEGVDEAQWAKLDRQNRKRNQEVHRVEKWFEIWDVLFPGISRPGNPWHEISAQFRGTPKEGEDYFATLFLSILDHKIQQGDIALPFLDACDRETFRERLRWTVQTTYRTYVSMRENLSLETSSSESNNRPSLLGASSTNRSSLGTTASQPATATTGATSVSNHPQQLRPAAQPNAYALDPSYGLGIPLPPPPPPPAAAAAAQAGGSPQFMSPLPAPVGAGPAMHHHHHHHPSPQMHGNIPAFAGMASDEAAGNFYYPANYMFPQGACQWIPGTVQFPPAPIAQNAALPPGQTWYFGESQTYGAAAGEGK